MNSLIRQMSKNKPPLFGAVVLAVIVWAILVFLWLILLLLFLFLFSIHSF